MNDSVISLFILALTYAVLVYTVPKFHRMVHYVLGYRPIHVTKLRELEKELTELYQQLEIKNRAIASLINHPVKREKGGQLTLPGNVSNSTNGHKIALVWNDYFLVFRNQFDRMCFTSENYLWVERDIGKVGKRDDHKFEYRWLPVEDFNPKTDVDILVNFPYIPGSKTELIPDDYLPFKWEKQPELVKND